MIATFLTFLALALIAAWAIGRLLDPETYEITDVIAGERHD